MGVTTTQLQSIAKFTYGAATHHVERVSEDVSIERVGQSVDAFIVRKFEIRSYIEGTDLADLKAKLDALESQFTSTGQNFALYRAGTKVREILAADAHFGPVASLSISDAPDCGTLQGFAVTVEARIPASAVGGMISHTYDEESTTDDDGDVTSIDRIGRVQTEDGTSAKGWIEANIPAKPNGYIRELQIKSDKTDTNAEYTIIDTQTPYRNQVPGTIKTHEYTDSELKESGVVTRKIRSGHVETISPTDPSTWINANLPALDSGFERRVEIRVLDTNLVADYTVTDEKLGDEWSPPPGIDEGQIDVRTSVDSQYSKVVITSGFLIGSNAQSEVSNIRSGLSNIIRDEVKINTLGDGRVDFTFTQLLAENDDDFLSWQETIRVSGGGVAKEVVLHPDRAPFVVDGVQLPWIVTVNGSAQGLGQYVAPPGMISAIQSYIDGDPEINLRRDDDEIRTTSWSQRYVVPFDPGAIKPSNPIVAFLP